jgi:hypothetical protein
MLYKTNICINSPKKAYNDTTHYPITETPIYVYDVFINLPNDTCNA